LSEQRYGNYRVVRKLGEGGMGVVFEALHDEIGKRAVIKVLHQALSGDSQLSARFLTEARAVNMVHHPGLVSIFEFGRTPEGAAYLVMEYLDGETLRARMTRERKLSIESGSRILRQVSSALAVAHEKSIVHRDLKPENIMLVPEPELPGGERAKVLDFGVAKVTQTAIKLTAAGTFLGTPAYMAPEQCLDAVNVTEKTDVYALGVIFYEMLAGTPPFVATGVAPMLLHHIQTPPPPIRELAPELPESLAGLVMRMLAKAPAERPLARDLVRALEAPASGQFTFGNLIATPVAPTVAAPAPAITAPVSILPASVPPVPAPLAVPLQNPLADGRSAAFVHRCAMAMTVENYTFIEHPLANGDPGALCFITPNWNPGGQGGAYNNHHTGVWWASNARWSIYNEDRLPLPTPTSFNVLVTKSGFVHRAVVGNIVNNWTLIDHPDCNNRKDALLLITANWNPGGYGGTYNNHAIGVWYTNGRWSIYNQDRLPMPVNAAWNILVAERTFCHRVTAANLIGANISFIDHPAARGNPDAVVLVTANWNPGGQGGLYNDHAIGVHYYGGRWTIFNQDVAPLPPGAAFNVWIG
jgi:hypothetical protein